MPAKRMNGGTNVNVDEVFDIAEMYRLAEEWATGPTLFESLQLERYRELCAKYGMDSSILLYEVQNHGARPAAETTRTFPAVGEVPQVPAV